MYGTSVGVGVDVEKLWVLEGVESRPRVEKKSPDTLSRRTGAFIFPGLATSFPIAQLAHDATEQRTPALSQRSEAIGQPSRK